MACSKLFTGDLPEVSIFIIENLRNDFKTLYSLALVNRFWCRLTIPILWEDPFSMKCRKNFNSHFFDTYFLSLNDTDKNKLNDIKPFNNKIGSKFQKPLFNYPGLIKSLDIFRIRLHIITWLNLLTTQKTNSKSSSISSYCPLTLINHLKNESEEENEPFFQSYGADEEIKDICIMLFKLFIENKASLTGLYVSINTHCPDIFYELYNMILDYPKFISRLKIFTFECYYWPLLITSPTLKSFKAFLTSLLPLFKSLDYIDLFTNNIGFNFDSIIKSQPKLTSIKFRFPILFEIPLLESLENSSNTLTSITFFSCRFSDFMNFDALSLFTKLESLQFKHCSGLNSKVIQPLLNITAPLKIKTFVIISNEVLREDDVKTGEGYSPIQLLIQKIGPYIENLVLNISDDELRKRSFDSIIDSCEKVKFLHLSNIDHHTNISQLSKMIVNFNNYLKYLTLEIKYCFNCNVNYNYSEEIKVSTMILKELSTLSLSLCYLDLNLVISPIDLKEFFENYNQVKIEKLLLRNRSRDDIDTTLKIVKDFVENENVEYLCYGIGDILSSKEEVRHESLKDLVEETKSFVKMLKYDDLVMKISEEDGSLITLN